MSVRHVSCVLSRYARVYFFGSGVYPGAQVHMTQALLKERHVFPAWLYAWMFTSAIDTGPYITTEVMSDLLYNMRAPKKSWNDSLFKMYNRTRA